MKKYILLSSILFTAGSLLAADAMPKGEVTAAALALGNSANYSWHTVIASPGGGGRFNGPTDGKTEKAGYTFITMTRGDNTTEAVLQGTNGAVKTPDNGWETLAELAKDTGNGNGNGGFNPNAFLARALTNYKTPDAIVTNLVDKVAALKIDGDAYAGDLTEDGAKSLLSMGRRPGGGAGPDISNAKGSVKFWLKDGLLVKYELKVSGTVSFNGNDRDVDRTTTVDIKDVGTTKVEVPDEAKKKL